MRHTGSDVILERLMSLHPKIIDLTLDRVYRLLDALGNPHLKLAPVIHVAGTNGKGSTLAMIRAGLEGAGKRVQVYTSPHLVRFHERIRMVGGLIPESDLSAILEECEDANGGAPITYFEITTVAAILAFSRQDADYCLMEVGLGGRLDATNVFERPALTVITPVALDHQQYLGDTLAKIAFEKAGILKPGVPCVVGPQADAAMDVIEAQATELASPLLVSGQDFQAYSEHGRLAFQDEAGLEDLPLPALPGTHQIENAGTALAALRTVGIEDLAPAMTNAVWPARMQRLSVENQGEVWLDGGHNPAAGAAIAVMLGSMPARETVLIAGMLNTKDPVGFFEPLAGLAADVIAIPIPDAPATLSAAETAAAATSAGLASQTAQTIHAAMALAKTRHPDARIVICGSLYLAGHVLAEFDQAPC